MGTALATWVPEERPRKLAVTLHGDLSIYAELSDEDSERGKALRDGRCRRRLGLREAATRCGISAVELSECERGVRRFNLNEALRLLGWGNE